MDSMQNYGTVVKLAGQMDSWTHLLVFTFLGYIFAIRRGAGGGAEPLHINIYKMQSFIPIFKQFTFLQLSN